MKKIINMFLIVAIIFGAVYFYIGTEKRKELQTKTLILEKVKNLKELNVMEYNYSGKIVDKKGNYTFSIFANNFQIPSTWSEIAILYEMKVKAAIDLSTMNNKSIELKGKNINIKISKPYISCTEPSNIDVIESNGLFTPNKDYKDVANIYNENMKNLAKDAALKDGIINRSEKSAVEGMKSIITKVRPDIKNVNIIFE